MATPGQNHKTRCTVQLFGTAQVLCEGAWQVLPTDKRGALLVYLAYHADWVNREQLAFLFWPDTSDKEARRNLRQLLNRAKALPVYSLLEFETGHLRLHCHTDVIDFRRALAQQDWQKVITLHQTLCENLKITAASSFVSWLELERKQLDDSYKQALHREATRLEKQTAYAEATGLLGRYLALDLLAEDVLQRYMRLAYLAGQRDDALTMYERFAAELKNELGLKPLAETQELLATLKREGQLEITVGSKRPTQLIPLSVMRPPRLVGRDAELQKIIQTKSLLVLLEGEAGVGKSRLMAEVSAGALQLRCQEGLKNIPYHPVATLIKELQRQNVATPELGPYLEDLVRFVPSLAPEVNPGPADPTSSKTRLLEAISLYFEKTAQTSLFQLAIDDLQWADPSTLELLHFLSQRRSLRIIGTYRKHEVSSHLRQSLQSLKFQQHFDLVKLEPLDTKATKDLLSSLMNSTEGPDIFSNWLHQNTAGNPMFMLETLKSLFESGDLHTNEEGWHSNIDNVTKDYSELSVPQAVIEIIERRIHQLSEEAQRSLQLAAVMGEGFTPHHLSEMAGFSAWAIMDVFEQMETAGMTVGESFSHDLIRQAVYQKIPKTKRQLLHERVALQLTTTADPEVLAEHWYKAGNAEKASALWEETVDRFRQTGRFYEATLFLERLIRFELDKDKLLSYKCDLILFHNPLNNLEKSEFYAKSISKSLPSHSPFLNAKALLVFAGIDLLKGTIDSLESNLREANQLVEKYRFDSLNRDIIPLQIRLFYERGQFRQGLSYCQCLLEHSKQLSDVEINYELLNGVGMFNSGLGHYDQALNYHLQALEFAKEKKVGFYIANTALNLLVSYTQTGHLAKGVPIAEEALTLGYYECTDFLRNNLAAAYVNLERYDEALNQLEEVTRSKKGSLRCAAWARIALIHDKCNRPEFIDQALTNAFSQLTATEVLWAHAQVVSAALKVGSKTLIQRGLEHIKTIDKEKLPKHVKKDLEQALSRVTPA